MADGSNREGAYRTGFIKGAWDFRMHGANERLATFICGEHGDRNAVVPFLPGDEVVAKAEQACDEDGGVAVEVSIGGDSVPPGIKFADIGLEDECVLIAQPRRLASAAPTIKIVSWNLEAWNPDDLTYKAGGRTYRGAAASLAASHLHPRVTPGCWDVLVLVESGTRRLKQLSDILADEENFAYEHVQRPGADGMLGVLIVWRTSAVTRDDYTESVVIRQGGEYSSHPSGFAYLAVPLRPVGSNTYGLHHESLWVGGIHMKAGDTQFDRDARQGQADAIYVQMKRAYDTTDVRQSVIAGDFNHTVGPHTPLARLARGLGDSSTLLPRKGDFSGLQATHVFTRSNPYVPYASPIDYALVSPGLIVTAMTPLVVRHNGTNGQRCTDNIGFLNGTHVSDHLPLQFSVMLPRHPIIPATGCKPLGTPSPMRVEWRTATASHDPPHSAVELAVPVRIHSTAAFLSQMQLRDGNGVLSPVTELGRRMLFAFVLHACTTGTNEGDLYHTGDTRSDEVRAITDEFGHLWGAKVALYRGPPMRALQLGYWSSSDDQERPHPPRIVVVNGHDRWPWNLPLGQAPLYY